MPDEIIIKSKSGSDATPATSEQQDQNLNITRTTLTSLCAGALAGCFFLPWAQIWGKNISGFDLQKLGDRQLLLWLIPICSGITIFAGAIKRSQSIAGQFTGLLPFFICVYWYLKLGNDLFQILSFGAYLSMFFGLGLLVLSCKSK